MGRQVPGMILRLGLTWFLSVAVIWGTFAVSLILFSLQSAEVDVPGVILQWRKWKHANTRLRPVLHSWTHWCPAPVGLWKYVLLRFQTSRACNSDWKCLSDSTPLAFLQPVTLCDLYIVILHSWASFFPFLLRDVQDNVGIKNTEPRAWIPGLSLPGVWCWTSSIIIWRLGFLSLRWG